MTFALELDVLGTRFRLRLPTAEDRAVFAARWAPFVVGADNTGADVDVAAVTNGDAVVVRALALKHRVPRADLTATVAAVVNREALGRYAGLAAHAGVVARGAAAVVLPGESGRGKSTLTAACVLAGFDYASDEALCLGWDDPGVTPYPKPVALSGHSARLLGVGEWNDDEERLLPPERFGRRTALDRLAVAHVVALERSPGPPALTESHPGDALGLLLPRCFNHYRHPARTLATLSALAAGARTWRLTYDSPGEAAALLAERLG